MTTNTIVRINRKAKRKIGSKIRTASGDQHTVEIDGERTLPVASARVERKRRGNNAASKFYVSPVRRVTRAESRFDSKSKQFDTFLCYNSGDKDAIRVLNTRLKDSGIVTWFDEDELPPGRVLQDELERQISSIKSAIVAVGQAGIGPWQNVEIRAFISEFIRCRCPIIPLILPDCEDVPDLPLFLRQFSWVDLRKTSPDPFKRLIWGLTGEKQR
jgi:hypothetical protein